VVIRTLIVEDEPIARQTLRELIAETSGIELVGEVADGASAVRAIDELKPDLIFLDVELPEMNGLQVLESVSSRPEVVFTTAYDAYAISAFELEALDYLLKPFGRERFRLTVERVRRRLAAASQEVSTGVATVGRARHALQPLAERAVTRLFVRDGDMLLPVAARDIIRLEACDDYTAIHHADKRHLIHLGLSELTARLAPEKFLRVHRSHTVNLDHVNAAEEFDRRLVLYMSDGSEVTASRSGTQEFRKFFTLV
jgi:two-component system LytT family response regulator